MDLKDPLYYPFPRSTFSQVLIPELCPIPEVEEVEVTTGALKPNQEQTTFTMASVTVEPLAPAGLSFVAPKTPQNSTNRPSDPKVCICSLPDVTEMDSVFAHSRTKEQRQALNEKFGACRQSPSADYEEYMALVRSFKQERAMWADEERRKSMAAKKPAALPKEMRLKIGVYEKELGKKEGAAETAIEEAEMKREKRNVEGEVATREGKFKRLVKWLHKFWHKS